MKGYGIFQSFTSQGEAVAAEQFSRLLAARAILCQFFTSLGSKRPVSLVWFVDRRLGREVLAGIAGDAQQEVASVAAGDLFGQLAIPFRDCLHKILVIGFDRPQVLAALSVGPVRVVER